MPLPVEGGSEWAGSPPSRRARTSSSRSRPRRATKSRRCSSERLAWSLRHAYENVPHYRRSFDAAGVHPDDLKELADLRRFPFTTKDDLRANYPFGMFAVPRERIARIHASSGTTGKPTVVGYTARDLDDLVGADGAQHPRRRRAARA